MTKRFSASSAAQLMQCHGSANLELAIPGFTEPPRDDAAGAKGVGSRLHEAFKPLPFLDMGYVQQLADFVDRYSQLNWRVRRELMTDISLIETTDWVRKEMPYWTDTDIEQALTWLQKLDKDERLPPAMLRYVADTLTKLSVMMLNEGPSYRDVHAEKTILCTWLKSSPQTTADLVITKAKKLIVVDYKTGKIPVSPVDNFQLMFYAMSVLWDWYTRESWVYITEIEMHIWQPNHFESHTIRLDELLAWARLARKADIAITAKDLTLIPGDACTFCPANPQSRGDKNPPYCPAMMALLYPDPTNEEEILDL